MTVFSSIRSMSADNRILQATRPDGSCLVIEPHMRDLWDLAMSGGLGPVAAYVPPPPAPKFRNAAHARAAMVEWVEAFTAPLRAGVPVLERLSYPAKTAAAAAYLASDASADQVDMIEGEAELTGEDPADLAALILEKSATEIRIASKIAGLRRRLDLAIDEAVNPFEYEAILEAGQIEAAALAVDLGLGSVLGVA
jgi:hypothetical protein